MSVCGVCVCVCVINGTYDKVFQKNLCSNVRSPFNSWNFDFGHEVRKSPEDRVRKTPSCEQSEFILFYLMTEIS